MSRTVSSSLPGKQTRLRAACNKSLEALPTITVLVKSALPPTIGLCILLSPRAATFYGPIGYIVAVNAINPCLPQAQHIELILRLTVATSIACALTLLQIFCAVKAREHTSSPLPLPTPGVPPPPPPYNSSAAAVTAIWLMFNIYVVSYVRSARKDLMLPCITFTIFVGVSSSFAPLFPNMDAGIAFAVQLLEINLSGFAISAAVTLLILPETARGKFCKGLETFVQGVERCLAVKAAAAEAHLLGTIVQEEKSHGGGLVSRQTEDVDETRVAASVATLIGTFDTVSADLKYARVELGFGTMDAQDLIQIREMVLQVLQPVLGLMASVEFLKANLAREYLDTHRDAMLREHHAAVNVHQLIFDMLGFATGRVAGNSAESGRMHGRKMTADDALEAAHVPDKEDVSSVADFETRLRRVREERESRLGTVRNNSTSSATESDRQTLFFILQSHYLLDSACVAALALAKFAEDKTTKSNPHIVFPSPSAYSSWLWEVVTFNIFAKPHRTGVMFDSARDPEHLPPRNALERVGNALRGFSGLLNSPHSSFAFRTACAVLSSQILGYLQPTQRFFNVQRVFWASLQIAIAMMPTAGQFLFGILSQVAGTVLACILSLLVWYIVDRKIPGVMVFYFLIAALLFCPSLRRPQYFIFSFVSVITLTLLVGYELERERIGEEALVASGQPYYPVYVMSWIRLLVILAGLGMAYFWMLFPYPVLETTELPKQLAQTFSDLSYLHFQTHLAASARMRGVPDHGEQHFADLVTSHMAQLARLRQLLDDSKYQIQIGGRFPRQLYARIVDQIEATFRCTMLILYASHTLKDLDEKHVSSAWLMELRRVVAASDDSDIFETNTITALSACETAIAFKRPLPPSLQAPEPAGLLESLESSEMQLLHPRHALEPGYAALATIHASSMVLADCVRKLVDLTGELVGRVEFDRAGLKAE